MVFSYTDKDFINIMSFCGAGGVVLELFVFGSHGVDHILSHHSLVLQVYFVSQHERRNVFRVFRHRLVEKLVLPHQDVVERLFVCDVEHEYARLGPAVELGAETLVALLTSSVPNLQSNTF